MKQVQRNFLFLSAAFLMFAYPTCGHFSEKPDASANRFQNLDRIRFEDLKFRETVEDENGTIILRFDKYYTTYEIHEFMDYLKLKYNDLVEILDIGQTWEGRTIKTMKISSKNVNNSAIWIDGGIHAREWISVSSVCFIMYTLLTNWKNLDAVFQNVDYYLTPVLNPDGYEYSHSKHTRMWRKNRRKIDFCYGVDLNRNFPYKWKNETHFKFPQCDISFAGPNAQSEPETRAVTEFILQHPNKFKGFLSFHTHGQSILYPYGYEVRMPKDVYSLQHTGQYVADKVQNITGLVYKVAILTALNYSSPGNSVDWAYEVAGITYSYGIELRGTSFVLPPSEIIPIGKEASIIAMAMIDNIESNVRSIKDPL